MSDTQRVLTALCTHGLSMRAADMPSRLRGVQEGILGGLLEEVSADDLVAAIRYGMPEVWPFIDGRAYDAADLKANLLKALAAAAKKKRASATYLSPGDVQ